MYDHKFDVALCRRQGVTASQYTGLYLTQKYNRRSPEKLVVFMTVMSRIVCAVIIKIIQSCRKRKTVKLNSCSKSFSVPLLGVYQAKRDRRNSIVTGFPTLSLAAANARKSKYGSGLVKMDSVPGYGTINKFGHLRRRLFLSLKPSCHCVLTPRKGYFYLGPICMTQRIDPVSDAVTSTTQPSEVDGVEGVAPEKIPWKWEEHFGRVVRKNDPIWEKYVEVSVAHDKDIIEAMSHNMDILLVFSTLFSAVVTTLIAQVEPSLDITDPAVYSVKTLEAIYDLQYTAVRNILDGSLSLAYQSQRFQEGNNFSSRITAILWYFSLDCALLVTGGAICMKMWLLEYRRSNNSHRIPYNRAIRHQETYASLRQWFIPEFGDLLGCLVLLDLVLFFAGVKFHLSKEKTGTSMFYNLACIVLGTYSAFLAFTTIVGTLVPTSPHKTPISNLVRAVPRMVLRKLITDPWYTIIMAVVFVAAVIVVFIVWMKTSGMELWFILLWIAPMGLTIQFGLRNGLKLGRIAHFVPLMGIAIGILTTASLSLALLPDIIKEDTNFLFIVLSFCFLVPFTLVVAGLSRRFSTAKSQRNFPVRALYFSAVGIVSALLLSWNYTSLKWVSPTSGAVVCASMMILSMGALLQEGEVEEDTRESEALGWLIRRSSDIQTLHSALACIPSIANTPFRRQLMLKSTRHTLILLINSLIDIPEQRCLIKNRNHGIMGTIPDGDGGLDRESRLMFYLACLAEVSQMNIFKKRGHFSKRGWLNLSRASGWSRCTSVIRRSWMYNNWYRFLTLPTTSRIFTRELRFLHHWHPWIKPTPPDPFRVNLNKLSTHRSAYLRIISRAVLSQLYPLDTLSNKALSWPTIRNHREKADIHSSHGMLVELRMITSGVIDAYHYLGVLEPLILRHLLRYCDNVMKDWTSGRVSQKGSIFEVSVILSYLVMENDWKVIGVTRSGDSIPMKAARCLMALASWRNRIKKGKLVESAMDKQLHTSFALSIVSATARYLQLAAAGSEQGDSIVQPDEGAEEEEESVATGMKYLEQALLHLMSEEWPVLVLDEIASALEGFYSIIQYSNIRLLPLDPQYDLKPLMIQLKNRAASITHDRVSAIRAISMILKKVSAPSQAWPLANVGSESLPAIINDMAQSESIECRVAAFSALLDIPIFQPKAAGFREGMHSNLESKELDPSSSSQEIRVDMLPPYLVGLVRVYTTIFEQPSPLLSSLLPSSDLLDERLIDRVITVVTDLVDDPLLSRFLLSKFPERDGYLEALASIASNDSSVIVPLSTRNSAIHLFARLWPYSDQWVGKDHAGTVSPDGILWCKMYLGKISKAVDLVVDNYSSIEPKCIQIWVKLLEEVCTHPGGAEAVSQSGLLESLSAAVAWTDFDGKGEDERLQVFMTVQDLSELNSQAK